MAKQIISTLSLFALGASALPGAPLGERQCGTVLAPSDIVSVSSDTPDVPGWHPGTPFVVESQQADKKSNTKTLLRFTIPPRSPSNHAPSS